MATGNPTDNKMDELLEQVKANTDYKVLTKEEYESLLAIASHKTIVTSTPQVTKATETGAQATRPKFTFTNPGISPVPRLQQVLNSSHVSNTSFVAPPFNFPKLPFFSGSEEPLKGETTYEVWDIEVKCLQNSQCLPEHVLLQAIRSSLKGAARSLLVPLGENAQVADILNKLDGFYGNVSTGETLIQAFYNDYQKDTESIVAYGSRLEQTLSRAVRCGHIDLIAKDAMLRSKFWTGLKSQYLKNSTRHLYDSIKDFQMLLREIRKVESEETNMSRPAPKQKAQQQSGQAETDQSNTNDKLLKQMSELMGRMKSLEQRLENQQQPKAAVSNQPSFQQNAYQNQRGRGFRGQNRGNFGRGNFDRGFQDTGGNFQSNYARGGFRGGRSWGGYRGGTGGRGANQGGDFNQNDQPLN